MADADLTGLFEAAALSASVGQAAETLEGRRFRFRHNSTAMDQFCRRLVILEGRLQ